MKVAAIIQARMGSTRLPCKVLMDIEGTCMLGRVVQQAGEIDHVSEVIVATSVLPGDDPIVEWAEAAQVRSFRGSESDVLDRYYQAALDARAEAVVRITADCPLLDPQVSSQVVRCFLTGQFDYVSNIQQRTFPRGLDTEVFSFQVLKESFEQAKETYQREHVTPFIHQQPERFRIGSVTCDVDHSDQRWTVDTPEDLEFVRQVIRACPSDRPGLQEVMEAIRSHPELMRINEHIRQKDMHQ